MPSSRRRRPRSSRRPRRLRLYGNLVGVSDANDDFTDRLEHDSCRSSGRHVRQVPIILKYANAIAFSRSREKRCAIDLPGRYRDRERPVRCGDPAGFVSAKRISPNLDARNWSASLVHDDPADDNLLGNWFLFGLCRCFLRD